MKRLQATDVAYLDVERPNTPPLMAALVILDPSTADGSFVRHRDILAYVESRLHLAPNLRRRLIFNPLRLDEPRMVDDPNFDLEFHVRHLALPRPRDRRQLNILVARLMSRPMDLNRPLWEMYIVEGLENFAGYPDDTFAVLFKLHHAAFDGAAGLAAIFAMMQDRPGAQPDPPASPWTPERAPGLADWFVSSLTEGANQIVANFQAVPSLVKGAYRSLGALRENNLAAPRTRFQRAISTHRVLDWINLPMAEVQAVRTALGKPKINDLVLTVIGGALREYLMSKGELPETSLVTLCPINVRGSGDPRHGGNQISAMRVLLGTDIDEPIERLRLISESSAKGKEQAENLGATFVADMLAFYPYFARAEISKGIMAMAERIETSVPMANVVVSNIPPPRGNIFFAGSKALEFTGFGPLTAGIGLFHTISGMEGVMSIAVNSGREIMPDVTYYMDCLRRSFARLQDAADKLPQTPAKSMPRAPRKSPAKSATAERLSAEAAPKQDRGSKRQPARKPKVLAKARRSTPALVS